VEIAERTAEVDGVQVHWRVAGERPVLYVHGVPTASWDWIPFLERTGGVAPDLPGFGESAKPAEFPYGIEGFADFLEAFTAQVGLERMTLVVHDWGGAALAFAQRHPERIERLVIFSCLPLTGGYRWHRVARAWRTPLVGELTMGFTTRRAFTRALPAEIGGRAWEDFDHGTQRAILKLYRAAPEPVLERAGARLGELRCPALVLWPTADPYIGVEFGRRYADALGGEVELEEVEGGHWTWLDRPALVDRVATFVSR
jgi:pimeloyl-ACP methyl ester carboxylesterase